MLQKISKKILSLIFENFSFKLLSIFLAVIVWAIIQGEQIQEINREVELSLVIPEGMGVRGDITRAKAVTIKGPQAWLLEVPKRLTAELVVPQGRTGKYRVRISKDDIKTLNDRLEISIHEPYVDLFVDKIIDRSVPIKEAIHGSPAEGFIVERVTMDPKSVVVKGIRYDLLNLRHVYTEPIDVTGIQNSRTITSQLILPGSGFESLSQTSVSVTLHVGDSKINKRFGDIPVEVVGSEYTAVVKPQTVSIMVQGVPGVLNFLKKDDFKAFIEVRGLSVGRYERDIKVKIPADTALIETFPEKGIVNIERR